MKSLSEIIEETLVLPQSISQDAKYEDLRRILLRDTYFLQRERTWLAKERDSLVHQR